MVKKGLLILLAITLTACGSATSPTEAPAYYEDFADSSSGWDTSVDTDLGIVRAYADGGYRITLTPENYWVTSYPGEALPLTDSSVEVDVRRVGGPDENEIGIVCRDEPTLNPPFFYVGLIGIDQYYAIYFRNADTWELLDEGTSDSINQGDLTNHLRFDCIGPTLSLYANGTLLTEVTDNRVASGETSVYVGSIEIGGVEVLFDNYTIRIP